MAEYWSANLLSAMMAKGRCKSATSRHFAYRQLLSWCGNKSSHAEHKLFFCFVVCDRASVSIADRVLQLGYEPIARLEYSRLTYRGRPIIADSFRWQRRGNCANFWPRKRRVKTSIAFVNMQRRTDIIEP